MKYEVQNLIEGLCNVCATHTFKDNNGSWM